MTQPFKISKIFKEMKHLTYVSDGLVLTCCDTGYVPGTDPTLLKWKPAEENTIDLKLALTFPIYVDEELPKHDPNREYPNYDAKPEFKLFVWKGGDDPEMDDIEANIKKNGGEFKNSFKAYQEWNVLDVTDEEWAEMKESGESFNGRIVEVRRNPDGKWRMLRFRDDKLNGNYVNVVLKVLKSIEDAVKKEELIAAEPEIKRKWEEREKRRHMRVPEKRKPEHGHHEPVSSQHPHHHHQPPPSSSG
ncbi:unnamed protein product [Ambrosiozyma monospora]|uniref:Unnamed protein product n=1 Tax=Ambrosiozyma monospora TaxID=43982 RepID=A0ACB5UEH2_AMBMO|nr:unnamed protein product [Ambrosiozyma monospora]